jgi:hypothetical protein
MGESRVVRHPFSQEEDEKIRELVSTLGEKDWTVLSEQMPGRTPRQCKERWSHYLSPVLIHEKWSNEEDDLLFEKVSEHGKKWKNFEKLFPGRTDINIKNRYNVLTRKKAKELKIALKLPLKRRRKSLPKPTDRSRDWGDFVDLDPAEDLFGWTWNRDSPFF